ncbi:polysaccharide biosynthesis protein [Pseudomonas putida]|nr:polysaccharide biosynthesis protein [Pseudomonas putida]
MTGAGGSIGSEQCLILRELLSGPEGEIVDWVYQQRRRDNWGP